jgi:hypothetical protein
MFELSAAEKAEVIANCDHLMKFKFAKSLPYAFTEHCAIMAASVLNSSKAVQVSVFAVRPLFNSEKSSRAIVNLPTRLQRA